MFGWLRARLEGLGRSRTVGVALIANWLADTLWNIETKFYSLAQQAYGQNEIIYACLRLLSQAVPEPPLMPYEMSESGATKAPLAFAHPLRVLIRQPNELMTEYEFWELTTLHMALVGRSCWWKERNRLGEIIGLWPLRPDRVGPIYSTSQETGRRVLKGWSYQEPGTGEFVALPRTDVLTFNFPDPVGESGGIVEGFGPVQVLARQIASDNEATKFVGALLANYAAPTTIIKVKKTIRSEEDAKLVKAKFRHEFGGTNRGTPALIDGDTEIDTLGFNLQELEFPELRTTSESRIAAALGVPAILVGLKVGLREGNNRASVAEQRAYFAETTLSSYWRRYQDQYTSDIAKEFGLNIVCEFDILTVRALGTHFQQKLAPVKDAFKEGVITRNEYRSHLNLPLLEPERGDVFVLPNSTREVPVAGQIADELGQEGSAKPIQESGETTLIGEKRALLPAIKAAPDEEEDEAFQRDLEQPFIDDLEAALRPIWAQAVKDIPAKREFPEEEFIVLLAVLLERELARIATAQFLRSISQTAVGFDPAQLNIAASTWAKTYTYDLVQGITATTRDLLQQATAKYFATPGMTVEQLGNLLEPAFGRARAEMIAWTETTRARSMAVNDFANRMEAMGAKVKRVWLTRLDERVCIFCGPLHGKSQEVWQAVAPTGPPLHVRCRCGLYLVKP